MVRSPNRSKSRSNRRRASRNSRWDAKFTKRCSAPFAMEKPVRATERKCPHLKDSTGLPVRPRDFNTGLFRGGHTGRDLYLRIKQRPGGHANDSYDAWCSNPRSGGRSVHYVQSLRRTDVS